MFPLFRSRGATSGLRDLPQLLGPIACPENSAAALHFLRIASPEFRG